jgi:integrase
MAIHTKKLKNGSRRYLVRVKDRQERQLPAKTFSRLVDAERYERDLKQQVDGGRCAARDLVRTLTFWDFFLTWHQECRSEVSEGWRSDQMRMAKDFVLPIVGQVKLQAFTPQMAGRIIEHVRSLGKGEQLCLHVYNTLHKAFEDAIHHYEYLETNPMRRRYKPRLVHQTRTFLMPEQSMRLLQHTRSLPLGPAIWISLLAGLRPSEVMALRYDAINFNHRVITIKAAYKRKVQRIEPYPKQANWGRAAMPPSLADYLMETRGTRGDDEFIASTNGQDMLSYHVLYKGLRKLCRDLDLPIVTPHELRHSCTELMVEAGASAEDLRRQLNHSSLASTKAYIHRTEERLQGIVDRIVVPAAAIEPLPPRRLQIVR